jgi:hypothetical protein
MRVSFFFLSWYNLLVLQPVYDKREMEREDGSPSFQGPVGMMGKIRRREGGREHGFRRGGW